ncbi:MAG: TIGR03790 family protein [Tepidisphaeraceae bacterium]
MTRRLLTLLTVTIATATAPVRAALTANDLLLVVNKNEPHSRELAEHYAVERHVPSGRVVEVDVPFKTSLPYALYASNIVEPVRAALKTPELAGKVKCIVLFHGLPLKIDAEKPTTLQMREAENVNQQLRVTKDALKQAAAPMEQQAARLDGRFKPGQGGDETQAILARLTLADKAIRDAIQAMPADGDRQNELSIYQENAKRFTKLPAIAGMPTTQPSPPPTQAEVNAIAARAATDSSARRQMRELGYLSGNLLVFVQVLEGQSQQLSFENNAASVDSELSMVLWPSYKRAGFLPNALNHNVPAELRAAQTPTIMTSRIDGPSFDVALKRLDESLAAEKNGLAGNFVMDTLGDNLPKERQQYRGWDQLLRRVPEMIDVRAHDKLTYDTKVEVLPPHSQKDVALYAGWYALRQYNAPCTFVPGAVAVHIASFELTDWGDVNGWCPNLLKDGAAVTLGAVDEPTLGGFPRPDEFFPLILTGKITLAEAYWQTQIWTSWKTVLVGDPLYKPFEKTPVLPVDDLAPDLRKMVEK